MTGIGLQKPMELSVLILSEPDWISETSETASIMLYTNPMEPENKSPRLWQEMLREMKQADDIKIGRAHV